MSRNRMQRRQTDAAELQIVDQLLEVDRPAGSLVGMILTWPFSPMEK